MGFGHGEKPALSEESIRPALMICKTVTKARSFLLLTQNGSQPATDKAVNRFENIGICMFEITKPTPQHRVHIVDDMVDVSPSGTFGPGSNAVPQRFQAFLTDPAFTSFKTIPQELKPLVFFRAVANMSFVWVQS